MMDPKNIRRLLEKSRVRLEILAGRMRACQEEHGDETHALSLFEVEGWVEEVNDALAANPESPGPETGEKRWSPYYGCNVTLVQYIADDHWWYGVDSHPFAGLRRAYTSWKDMPAAHDS